ncbi:hypothetical protein UFOVP591_14 [uncultured Caudovirales phage]|uniref:Uncharacterized protein n=1 Tax=uncultured Caudovirales phage TaxID=2100421 RepID=A0A6J5MVT9_9CAUD|nr:hypothetical protein UFOVP591_14 [uncultured Caudovirales phage]
MALPMQAKFYNSELEITRLDGSIVKKPTVFFRIEKASMNDTNAVPFIFEGPATDEHKKQFSSLWKAFVKSQEVQEPTVEEQKIVEEVQEAVAEAAEGSLLEL